MGKIFTILFFALLGLNNTTASTFSSVASGTWNAPATWTVTGVIDTDGIPDSDDDIIIISGHTVAMTSTSYWKTLTVQSTAILNFNGQNMYGYGDFTNNGGLLGIVYYHIYAPTIFTSSSQFTNGGNWNIFSDLTISAGTIINKTNYFYLRNTTVNNLGSVSLYGGSMSGLNSSTTWINGINSSLKVAASITGINTFNASATNNTVTYSPGQNMSILPATYYNLSMTGNYAKTATGNITVLNNFSLGGSNFNLNNFNFTISGNWNNTANYTIPNQGIITFNGSGTQTISRNTASEQINNMMVSGSGTVSLNRTLVVLQDLTINSGTLDLSASNQALILRGNLTNNSVLNCRQSTVTFNGSTTQIISGSTNTQFYNLTLSNAAGLTINSPQSLTNILNNAGGNFNSKLNFTLISNASSTARIAQIGGTATFSGSNMIIQKYISSRTANYHDLSSPVSNSTIMDWDNDLYMSGIGNDDGTPGPAGVDGTAAGDSSVWNWNEPTGAWIAVTGSSYPLVACKAYEVFIGDTLTTWSGRIIDTKGIPNYGSKIVNLSYTAGDYAGVHLLGNPYASAVNYSACTKTNITGSVLILDNTGNYADYGTSPVIPPHQGFWVTASGSGASFTFIESAKSTSTVTSFYRTVPNYGIKLVFSSPMLPFYNENTINFNDNGSLGYDKEMDALYLKSPNKTAPAIYMLTDSEAKLITNNIDTQNEEVSIPLAIYTPKEGVYYIEPNVLSKNNYNYVWIENTKTGKKHELNTSISIIGEEAKTNTDYVLRLSKKSENSDINQTMFDYDIIVFGTENDVNLKSINSTHYFSNVSVFDISGKLLIEENNMIVEAGQTSKIDISNLSSGVYIVNLTDNFGHVKTQKIIR